MRVTKRQLRRLIREAILEERRGASASDIARFKPQILEWSEVLLDELAEAVPGMKEISEKGRASMVKELASVVTLELVSLTSSMSDATRKELSRREKQKSHEEWDKERKRRGAGVQYWGDYQGSWST